MKKTAFEKLKSQVTSSYQSTFDFGSYEIDDKVKKVVVEKEAIISGSFEKFSKSQFEICKALYEVALELKSEGSFMAWYTHIGLTKDKVSELLKRYEVFIQLPHKEVYVSTLSNQAIKLLTHKNYDIESIFEIGELGLKKVEDIRDYLQNREHNKENCEGNLKISFNDNKSEEVIEIESIADDIQPQKFNFDDLKNYERTIKETKDITKVKTYKKEIHKLKAKILELERLCNEKIELSANDNNLTLC